MSAERPLHPPLLDDGGDGAELTVQVAGGGGEPERLLRISRPRDGLVRVRELSSDDLGQSAERELSAEALLRALEEAARQRRRLSEDMYRIRLWLVGSAS